MRAGQQGDGANAEFPQLAARRQFSAHRFKVNIPATRQWLAPEQGTVKVDQRAAAALGYSLHQVVGLGFELRSPVWDAHGGVCFKGCKALKGTAVLHWIMPP